MPHPTCHSPAWSALLSLFNTKKLWSLVAERLTCPLSAGGAVKYPVQGKAQIGRTDAL